VNTDKNKRKIIKRLRNKFRLVVMNDDTFEVKFSMLLSPLNLFTWGGLIVVALVILTISFVAFTPLREFIPGYADLNTRREASYAILKVDSLTKELALNAKYLDNIKRVMLGRTLYEEDSLRKLNEQKTSSKIEYSLSKEDSILRAKIEKEDRYNINLSQSSNRSENMRNLFFFTPLKGLVSSSFNTKEGHYGVDVIGPKNEIIKATLDGTVILATWTSETGHIIQIQHANNLVSIYKHNSVLLKKTGDIVRAGEGIAIIGESGELTTGPHLHFELWYNGSPIDPQDFMIF
jgi:murein DD-endopeptidase MepM/ murein hydrolase activator NlpD